MTISVAIVSPYASVRAGLQVLLAEFDKIQVVSDAASISDIVDGLAGGRADVMLVDLNDREVGRVAAAASDLESALVVLAEDAVEFQTLAMAPVRGLAYLSREADGPEIAAGVHAAAAGLIAIARAFAGAALSAASETRMRGAPFDRDNGLTAREMEVIQLMAQGLPNKTIAARLKITQNTAKFHVASVLAKLGASSRTEAVALGARQGLVIL